MPAMLRALPALILFSACAEDWAHRSVRVGPNEFPVMAWSGSPTDAESLRLMKEAGLNITGFCRVEELDQVRDAGLACIVSGTPLEAMIDKPETTDAEIRAAVTALAARIGSHPAAFGVYLRDEPNAKQMPMIGRLAAALRAAMPNKLAYVNLFPNYANREQLGTADYEAYVKTYLTTVKPRVLSWDNYSLTDGEMQPSFYDNLETARRLAMEARIPFWNCILATALFRYMEPSDATFSLQVYATLAYGGSGIQYFTYFSADNGNFRLAAIDHYGNRTATWDVMRRANNQVHALAPTMAKLRSTGVYHWPVTTAAGTPLLKDIKTSGKLLVGEFVDGGGRPYVMLVNKSLKESFSFRLETWKAGATVQRVSPVTGKEAGFGGESNWLAPGGGMLLRIGDATAAQ
ncbi:MAG TPA: hypothetical protein VGK29_26140 [Paludibaculum sp.]|jgi:hypothetical protein